MTLLERCKKALRIADATTAFDAEITALIAAGALDLKIAGVENTTLDALIANTDAANVDPLVMQAVTTYVRMMFGSPDDFDRLRAAYETQKAQLMTATNYTYWGGE